MPEWGDKPEKTMQDGLTVALNLLENEVEGNPSFESVIGIPSEMLMEHAKDAVITLISNEPTALVNPATWIQIYSLGFTVGVKYGEQRSGQKRTKDIDIR